MKSLRTRLYALWVLLAPSAGATAFVLYQFYVQSAAVQLSQTEISTSRACREIADQYAFYVAGWKGPASEDASNDLRADLLQLTNAALGGAAGIEGGLWSERLGSLAYAYPTYEGTGPKTDLPAAELSTITQVNADTLRDGKARMLVRPGRSQTLILQACPVTGPLRDVTAWSMARVYNGESQAYGQLVTGLAVLAGTVLGSALLLGRIILTNARRIAGLERALAAHEATGELPLLAPTGERELDRLVAALNQARGRLVDARSRLVASERLAAIGRVAAGIAHEIRNPMAAMRLKAENALAAQGGERDRAALRAVLDQIARLDRLLGDLLALTRPRPPRREPTDLGLLVADAVRLHAEVAATEGAALCGEVRLSPDDRPAIDGEQIARAVSNLILNAVQALGGEGGEVLVTAERVTGPGQDTLRITVADDGPGVPEAHRERIFEPFETTKASGGGLGLSLVREIAHGHGGDVQLVSRASGSLFELDLPWAPS